MNQEYDTPNGFLTALFDLTFSRFVTSKLIPLLYVLALILIGLGLVTGVLSGFVKLLDGDLFTAVMAVVITPLMALIAVVVTRVYLELIVVLFKIAENTREMAQAQKQMLEKQD